MERSDAEKMPKDASLGRLLGAIAIVMATQAAAHACSDVNGTYDSNPKSAIVVRASVTSFHRTASTGTICLNATYKVLEVLLGNPPASLEVSVCMDHPDSEVEFSDWETKEFGFVEGTEVFAGFTTDRPLKGWTMLPQEPGAFRYLVPSCWGPLHVRLDLVSDQERAAFVQEFRTSIKNWQ